MGSYERAFASLNPRQQEAVNHIDGPLLVVAGPGTGKTQLLSARVANILKSTDTSPTSILCLTFTNKASLNMQERIIELAGSAGARVACATFHSFAADIMAGYPDCFWNGARLNVAPEAVQLDIIESIISGLPFDNPLALKFAGQHTLISDVQRAINLVKDSGLTPDKLRALIIGNLAYIDEIEPQMVKILDARLSFKQLDKLRRQVNNLPKDNIDKLIYPMVSLYSVIQVGFEQAVELDSPTNKTKHTGDWKKRWIQSEAGAKGMFNERRRNSWWLELADVYDLYRQSMHQRGYYDYADMLVEVISQLEQRPEMLADIQERYSYVMIDEFQDCNPAQLRLAHLVAEHFTNEGKPNLMVVGDDDQSIFKFNGAELDSMLGFRRTYPSSKTIVLSDNYRSSQLVLDSAKKVIEQAEYRLVKYDRSLKKDLSAKNPPKTKSELRAVAYSSQELQLSAVSKMISVGYSKHKSTAVLARGHQSLIKMAQLLKSLNVPVHYEQQSNILDHEIIEQTYLVIKTAQAINQGNKDLVNALIHKIIRHPLWGIEPSLLWQLALDNYAQPDWLKSLVTSEKSELNMIGGWLLKLAKHMDQQPLAITLEQILGLRPTSEFTSPIRDYFLKTSSQDDCQNYLLGLSAINLLRTQVAEFGQASAAEADNLIRFIEINRKSNKIIADETAFITGLHGVNLLTVHKAKGLEFDEVYIIDAIEKNWRPNPGGRKAPANLPLVPPGDDRDDYIRLLYVAMTRAKARIFISGYSSDNNGQPVAMSTILQSVFKIEQSREERPNELVSVLEQNLSWPKLEGGLAKSMLSHRLENYSLSVTHLLNFLDIKKGGPEYFKERNLLRLPETKAISLSYGTATHSALETAQKLTNSGKFSLKAVQKEFSAALLREQVTQADFKRYEAKGHKMLKKLFNDFGYRLPKGGSQERIIHRIKLDTAVIDGKLDRLETDGGKLIITDYKSGAALTSFETRDPVKAIKAYKHKKQLIFYALMASLEPSFKKYKDIECQMVYVEADSQKNLVLSYKPTTQDIEELKMLIEAVWQKIQALDLPNIAKYPPTLEGILEFEKSLITDQTDGSSEVNNK